MSMSLALTLAFAVAAPAPAAAAAPRVLTDQDLRAVAAADFDRRAMMFRREIIGTHRGVPVQVSYPCGDVCPQNTRRILRYDVPVDQCDRIGGRIDIDLVPRGPSVQQQASCKPAVLVPADGEHRPATPPPPCRAGFLPRLASATDFTCAPPAARARARRQNANADRLRDPAGAYGPASCRSGFVWREAFSGDTVCVSPGDRAAAAEENRLGPERRP